VILKKDSCRFVVRHQDGQNCMAARGDFVVKRCSKYSNFKGNLFSLITNWISQLPLACYWIFYICRCCIGELYLSGTHLFDEQLLVMHGLYSMTILSGPMTLSLVYISKNGVTDRNGPVVWGPCSVFLVGQGQVACVKTWTYVLTPHTQHYIHQ